MSEEISEEDAEVAESLKDFQEIDDGLAEWHLCKE